MKSVHVGIVLGILSLLPLERGWADSSTSTVKMSLSANENYLRRFRKERESLASASDAESVQKREGLDKKIKNLEVESKRLEGLLKKDAPASPAAVAATPAVAPSVSVPAVSSPIPPAAGSAVAEWEKLSREEKEKYVLTVVEAFKKEGRTVERHPLFYTALMDYVFVSDASLAAKSLKEAVAATIQKNEASLKTLPKN